MMSAESYSMIKEAHKPAGRGLVDDSSYGLTVIVIFLATQANDVPMSRHIIRG
jgi:hypothetical protein